MKAAILTNRKDSFRKPLAVGLSRMLTKIGVESHVIFNGLASLPRKQASNKRSTSDWKGHLRWAANEGYSWLSYRTLLRDLRNVDFAVVVGHNPGAYLEYWFNDNRLRQDVPRLPIVLYDLVYLPTRGPWARWILENNSEMGIPKGQHWGLNRYDYHLVVTEVSEWAVPSGFETFSRIGVNLIDPSLIVEPNDDLVALIDFERPDHLNERAVQVQACIEAGIPYKVLHGRYPIADIRKIYRSCKLYFVACRESFGLPICELQACGALVLTPYAHWCPAHYLESPIRETERLPTNFIVYNNDSQLLVSELMHLKKKFNAQKVLANFKREQPHFYYGNLDELEQFVSFVKDGTVNPNSHKLYPTLSQLVKTIDEFS